MGTCINVFLADDHAVVRDGLRALLEAQSDVRVVGGAGDGREVVREVVRLKPDVVVMDITMPGMNGIDATAQIRDACASIRVLILSMHSSAEYVFRALQAGACGYLLKESTGAEVVVAVRAVHAGRRFLGPKVTSTVIDDYVREHHSVSPLDSLSRRERQILQLVTEGKSSAEAAEMLFLSPKTVDTYRSRLMHKLGINDFPGLVKFAIQHGLTSLE